MYKQKLLLLLAWMLVVNAYGQNTQLKKMYLASKEIDFQTTTLSSTSLPVGTSNGPANGMYDKNGALQFYINGSGVYDKLGNSIGSLLINTNTHTNEIVVAPFLDNNKCNNKYYIFYASSTYSSSSGGSLSCDLYIGIVEVSPLTGVTNFRHLSVNSSNPLATPTSPLSIAGSTGASLALSNIKNGKRNLYIVNGGAFSAGNRVDKIEISAPNSASPSGYGIYGIGNPVTIFSSASEPFETMECDLSADGKKLAFGTIDGTINFYPKYYIFTLTDEGDYSSHKMFTIPNINTYNSVKGVEFNSAGTKLFMSTGGGAEATRGIYVRDVVNNSTSAVITGSLDYSGSQIERAYNGQLYVAKSGLIQGIDPLTNALTASTLSTTTQSATYGYLLPDQIDECNYDNILFDVVSFTPQPGSLSPGTWTQTSNPFSNSASVIRIKNDLNFTTPGTYNLNVMNFEFSKDVKITIANGAIVNITGGWYKGIDCSTMWQGITVNNGGQLYININNSNINNKTYIEDALIAIQSTNSSTGNTRITVKNTEFEKNEKHIVLDKCRAYPFVDISGNAFKHTQPLRDQTYGVNVLNNTFKYGKTSVGIANLPGTNPAMVTNCTFTGGELGVAVYKAQTKVSNCSFKLMVYSNGAGVVATQMNSGVDIIVDSCQFQNVKQSFVANYCNKKVAFTNNTVSYAINKINAVDIYSCKNAAIIITKNGFLNSLGTAVALTNNAGASTTADVSSNTFTGWGSASPANYFVGVSVMEMGKPVSINTYGGITSTVTGLQITNNNMKNMSYGIKLNGIVGGQKNKATADNQTALNLNKITYSSTTTPNRSASDYNSGIQSFYSTGISFISDTIETAVAGQNKSWRNRGMQVEWTTSSLVKQNTIKAGRGLSAINEALGNNYTCNTFNQNFDAISLGDHWMRSNTDVHGVTGAESRENTFNTPSHAPIELYTVTPSKMPVYLGSNRWIFTSTPTIVFDPPTTGTIVAGTANSICGNTGGAANANLVDSTPIVAPSDTVIYWQWSYEYQRQQKSVEINNNTFISKLIDVQSLFSDGQYTNAQTTLGGMQATNTIEGYFKTVYTILLQAEIPEHRKLSSIEVEQLSTVAALWPQYAGPAVYVARAALWYQEGLEFITEADKNTPIIAKLDFEACQPSLPAVEVSFINSTGTSVVTEDVGIDSLGYLFVSPAYFNQLPTGINYAFKVRIGQMFYITNYLSIQEWLTSPTQHITICSLGKKENTLATLNTETTTRNILPVNIYPNPSSGIFTVQGLEEIENGRILVYDTYGKLVHQATAGSKTLDLTNQANGLYYIRIENTAGNVIARQTIMIQH